MTTYSNKSNALRAAKKIEGATVAQQDGRWVIVAPVAEVVYPVANPATMSYAEVYNALCPNCGIHLSNGLLTCDDEVANGTKTLYEAGELNHEYECMGCGKGFGSERVPYVAPAKAVRTGPVKHNGNKIDKVRPTQNGQTRPSDNTTGGKLWHEMDQARAFKGFIHNTASIKAFAESVGINTNSAVCALSHWRKFNGLNK